LFAKNSRICPDDSTASAGRTAYELVRCHRQEITAKEAWTAPGDLQFFRHVIVDIAMLAVRELLSASHFVADLTLGYGEGGARLSCRACLC